VIAILDSGRFGIAQLHQLRGRVGRGRHASTCVLVGRCTSPDGRARMEALVASTDGFYLSEVDLALRGHGQVFGTAQSGQSDLRVADLDTDRDLLVTAREHAARLLDGDRSLARHPGLRAEIVAVLGSDGVDWLGKS
jgi:ATP-dependent DNA helicase RecG